MALGRPATFDTKFDGKIIKDCDIAIKDNTGYVILDKTNVKQATTHLRNSFIVANYPSEETIIEVLNWSSLDQQDKDYLTTKNNFLYIKYCVDGVYTTGARPCFIQECKIDYLGQNATIRCCSWIETDYFKSNQKLRPSLPFSTNNTDDIYSRTLVAKNNTLFTWEKKIAGFTLGTSVINPFSLKTTYGCNNYGELLQNLFIACGGSGRLTFDDLTSSFVAVMKQFDDSLTPIDFKELNMLENYNIYTINGSVDSNVKGYTLGEEEAIFTSENTFPTGQSTSSFVGGFNYNIGFLANRFKLRYKYNSLNYDSNFTPSTNDSVLDSNYVYGSASAISGTSFVVGNAYALQVIGNKINLPYIEQKDNKVSISAYLIDNDDVQINIIRQNANNYLKYNTYLEASCRINPAIEPLDLVKIGGNTISVEEVEIIFNGGYKGKIGGRLIKSVIVTPIVQFSIDFGNEPLRTSIYLKNIYGSNVKGFVEWNGNQTSVVTINSGSTIVLSTNNYAWLNDLRTRIRDNNSYPPVMFYMVNDNNAITGEQNLTDGYFMPPLAFNIEWNEATGSDPKYNVDVRNPNNFDVTITFFTSSAGQVLQTTISALGRTNFNEQSYPALLGYFTAKYNEAFEDSLVAYFKVGTQNSTNTYVLEEDS